MAQPKRLYVALRRDLEPGAMVAQAVHAAVDLALANPQCLVAWRRESNRVVVVEDTAALPLAQLCSHAAREGLASVAFVDPDLDERCTAVALEPCEAARKLCRRLPLALLPRTPP